MSDDETKKDKPRTDRKRPPRGEKTRGETFGRRGKEVKK